MSQIMCSSINSKNYLLERNSSHPIYWPKRSQIPGRSLSESSYFGSIPFSYPPRNFCAKFISGISAKLANISHSYIDNNNSFSNHLFHNSSHLDDLLPTQVVKKMGSTVKNDLHLNNSLHLNCGLSLDMTFSESDCLSPSSSSADRTAFSDDERVASANNCDSSIDSDSSNDKRSDKIQISDQIVLQSMQNDRQKKKKRKRRRRKKKSSTKSSKSIPCPQAPCFSMSFSNYKNDIISIIIDSDSYDSVDGDTSSDEELTCLVDVIGSDLEMMCKSFFFDCFYSKESKPLKHESTLNNTNSGIDEIDSCASFSNPISSTFDQQLAEEEKEMTAIEESVRKANEKWSLSYSEVSSDDRISAKVNFSTEKPSIRVLHVWDYASRQARCGQWEQLARDRQRFAEKCRRIDADIGYIFTREHRDRVYRERVFRAQSV